MNEILVCMNKQTKKNMCICIYARLFQANAAPHRQEPFHSASIKRLRVQMCFLLYFIYENDFAMHLLAAAAAALCVCCNFVLFSRAHLAVVVGAVTFEILHKSLILSQTLTGEFYFLFLYHTMKEMYMHVMCGFYVCILCKWLKALKR